MLKSRSRFNDKNAIKLTYGHIQIKKFSGGETPGPHSNGAHAARDATVSNAAAGRGGEGWEMGEGKGRGRG